MPLTEYVYPLSPLDWVRVRIVTERPRIVTSFTVQYEAVIDGRTYPVVRYDCAHGDPHRDMLDADGRNVDKLWLPNWDRRGALDHAIANVRANFLAYRADFIARMTP
jgi:hypothetical protein